MTPRLRLAWFGAVVFVVVYGLGYLAVWFGDTLRGASWWGIDLALVLEAGARWSAGAPTYADPKFLYPPLAAVLAAPLVSLPFAGVSLVYAAIKIALATITVAPLARGTFARSLAITGVLLSLPFLHDLWLGNANALLVAAMVPAVLHRSRLLNGAPFGLAVALFAKPLAVPILLWLLIWRPRTFVGAVATAAGATLVGVALAGPGTYVDWLSALLSGTRFASAFVGNNGVTSLSPVLWLPVASLTMVGLVLVLLRRGPAAGLLWAVASGILVAPYANAYSALPILLALPALGRLGAGFPRLALAIVALSPLTGTQLLPFLAIVLLMAAMAVREWPIRRALLGRPAGAIHPSGVTVT